MLKEYVAKKIVDAAIRRASDALNRAPSEDGKPVDLEANLAHHLKGVSSWCQTVLFSDLQRPKSLSKIFVELSLYVFPRRLRIDEQEEISSLALKRAVSKMAESDHIILLGQPGAGKTTAMKHLCHKILFGEEFLAERVNVPIVIRLRDLNERARGRKPGAGLVYETIQEILGVETPNLKGAKEGTPPSSLLEQIVVGVLEELGALLILDGFDELATDKGRESVLADVRRLSALLEKSLLIMTSRSGEFTYSIDGSRILELSPLSKTQIAEFAERWLTDASKARQFLKDVERSPFNDAQIRPLNLAHLLAIYDRVGRIPEKPKTVYRKVVYLLLEDWDQQRSVTRSSRYADFEVDRKFEFLCALAFELTSARHQSVFSKDYLLSAYNKIRSDFLLPPREGLAVLSELEGHTGLLVRAGHELFEFSHKSIQEYLAAEHVVRLPSIPRNVKLLRRTPNELAIAVAISSRPSEYFCELVFNRFAKLRIGHEFMTSFVNRMLLERVDFERNMDSSLAFLILYSKYMDSIVSRGDQLSLFVREELLPDFERLAKAMIKLPIRSGMLGAYTLYDTVETTSGDKVSVLRLDPARKEFVRTPRRPGVRLPERLFVREGLIPGFQNHYAEAPNKADGAG